MNSEERAEAGVAHLTLARLYARDGQREEAAKHAESASRLLQPLPGGSDGA